MESPFALCMTLHHDHGLMEHAIFCQASLGFEVLYCRAHIPAANTCLKQLSDPLRSVRMALHHGLSMCSTLDACTILDNVQ